MRIAGPAHRRPGSAWFRRRHVISWCILAVMVATVLIQWGIAKINGPEAQRTSTVLAPPPTTWSPAAPATTLPPTPTPDRSAKRPDSPPPPQIPVPADTPPSDPPVPHTHKAKPLRAGPPTVRITAPKAGTQVTGGPGVLMTGTAAHLGHDQLDIFDYAPNGVFYLASDGGPVPVSGGHWSFQDATIGNGDTDVGKPFTLTAVIADTQCQATIRSTPRDGQNNIAYTTLPSGCRDADHVQVLKTAP